MTREEAIKYLKEMKDECNDTIHKVRYVTQEEALDMAIKALEQNESAEEWYKLFVEKLEQEPSGDLISKQAVIDAIEDDNRNGMWSCFVSDDDAQKFKTVIKELPSVKQEPFINKPCISEGVCHEDKVKVLDKIRAKIEAEMNDLYRQKSIDQRTLTIIHACQRHIAIIDEYTKGESEC